MISKKLIIPILLSWVGLVAFYYITRFYQLKINVSKSMPQKLWFVKVGDTRLKVGEYALIKYHDKRMNNLADYELVVKQVGGIGGDKIVVKEWQGYTEGIPTPNKTSWAYILPDGAHLTYDILSKQRFTPLTTTDMLIPQSYYFMHGQQHPSFDSRYKEFGLIAESEIFGKAYPVF